nr:hAT dimerization domain, ribonuclease H-like domain protein [Tanacetum cinerariifolium]
LKLIKTGLQAMVISEEWSSYREDDTMKANFFKEKIVNDEWTAYPFWLACNILCWHKGKELLLSLSYTLHSIRNF